MRRITVALLTMLIYCLTNCAPSKPVVEATVDFSKEIKPLLESSCLPCHHTETLFGGLNLETKHVAFRNSKNGTPIVPGDPNASLVYTKTDSRHGKQEEVMPADGLLLDPEQRDLLRRWIQQGATWPTGQEGTLAPLRIEPGEA